MYNKKKKKLCKLNNVRYKRYIYISIDIFMLSVAIELFEYLFR